MIGTKSRGGWLPLIHVTLLYFSKSIVTIVLLNKENIRFDPHTTSTIIWPSPLQFQRRRCRRLLQGPQTESDACCSGHCHYFRRVWKDLAIPTSTILGRKAALIPPPSTNQRTWLWIDVKLVIKTDRDLIRVKETIPALDTELLLSLSYSIAWN